MYTDVVADRQKTIDGDAFTVFRSSTDQTCLKKKKKSPKRSSGTYSSGSDSPSLASLSSVSTAPRSSRSSGSISDNYMYYPPPFPHVMAAPGYHMPMMDQGLWMQSFPAPYPGYMNAFPMVGSMAAPPGYPYYHVPMPPYTVVPPSMPPTPWQYCHPNNPLGMNAYRNYPSDASLFKPNLLPHARVRRILSDSSVSESSSPRSSAASVSPLPSPPSPQDLQDSSMDSPSLVTKDRIEEFSDASI